MKHILNNMSEEEKNAIREQHAGGMKVMTENFHKLLNSKLGDAKPLVNEQVLPGLSSGNSQNGVKMVFDSCKNIPVKIDNNSNAIADNIYRAIQGIGTDEDAIMKAFSMIPTLNAFCSVHHSYGKTYGNTLFSDLDGDIDEESVWAGISRILRNLKQAPVTKPTAAATSTPTSKRNAAATSTPTSKPTAAATSTPTSKRNAAATSTPTSKPTAAATSTPTSKRNDGYGYTSAAASR